MTPLLQSKQLFFNAKGKLTASYNTKYTDLHKQKKNKLPLPQIFSFDHISPKLFAL